MGEGASGAAPTADLDALLDFVRRERGFDFTGYKRPSLTRRIERRMQFVGVAAYADYQDYLQVHPDEFAALFDTILINVTDFFRDRSTWDLLAETVVPAMVGAKAGEEPIRVWSASCSTGQEAYSLAMLLAEALGPDAYRERVKIYATDVDEDALATARLGQYRADQVAAVPADLLERYFEATNGEYAVKADFRRGLIFGRHDLVQDAPISRIDLLACRNVLMYFNQETQTNVVRRLHFALAEHGVLLLGKAEMLLSRSRAFEPVDVKLRVFRKNVAAEEPADTAPGPRGVARADDDLVDVAMRRSPVAHVLLDRQRRLVRVNDQARSFFGLQPADTGRPFHDLELSYRPVELRSVIDRAMAHVRSEVVPRVTWLRGKERRTLEVVVDPLVDAAGSITGVSIYFTDVSLQQRLQDELEDSNRQLEAAYEELQSTNEELETMNEELQSTIEELETTNEELQSTNEELETMNEELQSANEELQTMNDQLRLRTTEVSRLNRFMESIVGSMSGAVVVLDRELQVLVWSPQAEELWGVREDETLGRPFLAVDIGLPLDRLAEPLRSQLAQPDGAETVMVTATNRRGRPIDCRVTISSLRGDGARGVIVVMEDVTTAA